MRRIDQRDPDGRQAGFTLLEALITIVVVSIGLLGILGLQTVSLVNTQVSAARSIATVAADNMADRIRANPLGDADDDYDGIAPQTDAARPDCSAGCAPAEIAALDAWEWNNRLAGQLPDGEGYVDCVETIDSECRTYSITIVWLERDLAAERNAGAPVASQCEADARFDNRCFVTLVRP